MFTGIVTGRRPRPRRVERRAGRRAARRSRRRRGYGAFRARRERLRLGRLPDGRRAGRGGSSPTSPAETLARSTLGALPPGDAVNLERALEWGDRLSGHFVMGHVDAVSRVLSIEARRQLVDRIASRSRAGLGPVRRREGLGGARRREPDGRRAARAGDFDVAVIPETLPPHDARAGVARAIAVNFEVDVFARYGAPERSARIRRAARRR